MNLQPWLPDLGALEGAELVLCQPLHGVVERGTASSPTCTDGFKPSCQAAIKRGCVHGHLAAREYASRLL